MRSFHEVHTRFQHSNNSLEFSYHLHAVLGRLLQETNDKICLYFPDMAPRRRRVVVFP